MDKRSDLLTVWQVASLKLGVQFVAADEADGEGDANIPSSKYCVKDSCSLRTQETEKV